MTDEDLQDPATWDFERAVPYAAQSEAQRAIVSVPLTPDELRRVQEGARNARVGLPDFIRGAALERADSSPTTAQ